MRSRAGRCGVCRVRSAAPCDAAFGWRRGAATQRRCESRETHDYSKKPFPVKHLHHKPRHLAGVDAGAETVDNYVPPGRAEPRIRRSQKKLSTMSLRPLAARLRASRRRTARTAIQHLDPPAAGRRRHRRRRRRRGGHGARAQPLQARLDPHPVRRPHRGRADRAGRQAGAAGPDAGAARRRAPAPRRRRRAAAPWPRPPPSPRRRWTALPAAPTPATPPGRSRGARAGAGSYAATASTRR